MAAKLIWLMILAFLACVQTQQFVFPDDVRLSSTVQPQRSQDRLDLDVLVVDQNREHLINSLEEQTSISSSVDSGQELRLIGGQEPRAGYLQIKTEGQWHLLCNDDSSFNLQAATVACRQLGYDQGAFHFQNGQSRIADLSNVNSRADVTLRINCRGDESKLSQCTLNPGSVCLRNSHSVGLVCNRPSMAFCPFGHIPFGTHCYGLFDHPVQLSEAQESCQQHQGHLVEIFDQKVNDFLTAQALSSGSSAQFWTGGVVTSLAGLQVGVWEHSRLPIKFNKFEMETNSSSTLGVTLSLHDEYYYWSSAQADQVLPYICQADFKDIGCLEEEYGDSYQGNASRTSNGEQCLNWNTPGLLPLFEAQDQWTHNFCRNTGGLEEKPICYVDLENYDYCDIPRCNERLQNRDDEPVNELELICNEAFPETHRGNSPNQNSCPAEQFQCQPDECIYNQFVCDGEPDCSDGQDELNCLSYTSFYIVESGFKLTSNDNPITDVTEEECAKRCSQSKHCTCTSFAYNTDRQRCLLGNRYSTSPFDSLIQRRAWNYYTLNATLDNNCKRVKRPATTEIEGLRLVNLPGSSIDILNVKINGTWGGVCDDGFSDNEGDVVCKQLGYELGAEQVYQGQGTDPNDLMLLHDMTCNGDERHISECHFEDHQAHRHECAGTEKVGLKCRRTEKVCEEHQFHCNNKECIHVNALCDGTTDCSDGSDEDLAHCNSPLQVRLSDGPNPRIGRVEVRHKGIWGTVCDDHFGVQEAQVVCSWLGFPNEHARVYNGTSDWNYEGDGPVWIRLTQDKVCSGSEQSLAECKERYLWSHDHVCEHSEDVAVTCDHNEDPDAYELNDFDDIDGVRGDFITDMLSNEATVSVVGPTEDCGRTRNELVASRFNIAPRIHGGSEAYYGDHPWQASLRIRGHDQTYHWCGAALISHFHLITAAHCLKDFPLKQYLVRVGDHELDVENIEESEYEIETAEFSEYWNVGPYLNNDIAIVTIKSNDSSGIRFGQFVSPVCLPASNLNYPPNLNLTITGWGRIGYEGVNSDASNLPKRNIHGATIALQEATVPLISSSVCTSDKIYGKDKVSRGMFCAGDLEGQADACQGDSGGPAVAQVNGRATLFGITSWGYGCGRKNKPGVYTKVREYVKWIQEKTQN